MRLDELKQEFDLSVDVSHIKYDWDAGHSYSYIDHTVMTKALNELDSAEHDEFTDHANNWLYENDECPPCRPSSECQCNYDDYEGWYEAEITNGSTFELLDRLYPELVAKVMIAKTNKITKS